MNFWYDPIELLVPGWHLHLLPPHLLRNSVSSIRRALKQEKSQITRTLQTKRHELMIWSLWPLGARLPPSSPASSSRPSTLPAQSAGLCNRKENKYKEQYTRLYCTSVQPKETWKVMEFPTSKALRTCRAVSIRGSEGSFMYISFQGS